MRCCRRFVSGSLLFVLLLDCGGKGTSKGDGGSEDTGSPDAPLNLRCEALPLPSGEVSPKWSFPLPSRDCGGHTECHLGSPVIVDVDDDPTTLEIVAVTNLGGVYVLRSNGEELWHRDVAAGMGRALGSQAIQAAPAVGDIDNDGQDEIVIATGQLTETECRAGAVIAYSHTGDIEPGWPKVPFDLYIPPGGGCPDPIYATPALGDLDGDKDLEVVVGSFDKRLYAWHHDGTLVQGFPASGAYGDGNEGQFRDTIWSSPGLADLSGDGMLDVITGTDEGNLVSDPVGGGTWQCPYPAPHNNYCGGSLYAFTGQGARIAGFPRYVLEAMFSSPVLTDIDGDGDIEIFVGSGVFYHMESEKMFEHAFRVFGFDHQGNALSGWENGVNTQGTTQATVAVGDVAGDAALEVVAFSTTNDAKGQVNVWYADGSVVEGFPVTALGYQGDSASQEFNKNPVLVDFDCDNKMEIVVSVGWTVAIIDGDGKHLTSTSLEDLTRPRYIASLLLNTPAVGDLNGDGIVELVTTNSHVRVWDLPVKSARADWPMFKHNPLRTSLYIPKFE